MNGVFAIAGAGSGGSKTAQGRLEPVEAGDGVALRPRKTGVQHFGHQRMLRKVLGDALRRRRRGAHPQVQRN